MSDQIELKLKDGNKIPALGLGTWQLTGKRCELAVRIALRLGYSHIDTAEIYGNHSEIGSTIADFDRKKIFLTSKVWRDDLRYDDVIKACERALEELDTDYLDLYLVHWPNRRVPMKETFKAMKELVEAGKVKSIGVSNFTVNHLKNAFKASKVPITVNQVEFHPRLYQKDLLEYCEKNDIVITAYSPLGHGKLIHDKTIKEISKEYGKSPPQVCLRWGLQKGVVVIPKASSEEHLKENLQIFDWEISEEDVKRIDSLNKNKRFINPWFNDFDY